MANSIKTLAKTGFGLGIGILGAQILFLLIGALFFIPGFLMYKDAEKKRDSDSGSRITSIVLMAIGVLIMGGLGFGLLLDNLDDLF